MSVSSPSNQRESQVRNNVGGGHGSLGEHLRYIFENNNKWQ